MALIAVFAPPAELRQDLTLAIEELGHRAVSAFDAREATELLAQSPQVFMIAADPGDKKAESFLAELGQSQPLLPVVVALTRRDAAQAVEFLKLGAHEVVSPPWTRENLSACLSKALRFKGTALEVVQPMERTRRALFYGAAVAAFLGLAFGYSVLEHRRKVRETPPPPTTEWELPYAHPSGLAYHGNEFWIVDWYSQVLYRHDPATKTVRRSLPLPGEPPAAIAFAGDSVWIVSVSGTLTKRMLDDRLTVLTRFSGFSNTIGMAYDGLYLWTLDGKEHKIFKHLMDDQLTVLASYDYPGAKPAAIAFDGKTLWSLDAGNRELLRHDIDQPRRVLFRVLLREYQPGQWRPTGLAWDGARFWSVAEAAGGKERPGRLFLHDVSLAPARASP